MGENENKKKDLGALRGFVHTGPSSAFSGMRYASLKRRYPAEHERILRERDEKEADEAARPTVEPGAGTGG